MKIRLRRISVFFLFSLMVLSAVSYLGIVHAWNTGEQVSDGSFEISPASAGWNLNGGATIVHPDGKTPTLSTWNHPAGNHNNEWGGMSQSTAYDGDGSLYLPVGSAAIFNFSTPFPASHVQSFSMEVYNNLDVIFVYAFYSDHTSSVVYSGMGNYGVAFVASDFSSQFDPNNEKTVTAIAIQNEGYGPNGYGGNGGGDYATWVDAVSLITSNTPRTFTADVSTSLPDYFLVKSTDTTPVFNGSVSNNFAEPSNVTLYIDNVASGTALNVASGATFSIHDTRTLTASTAKHTWYFKTTANSDDVDHQIVNATLGTLHFAVGNNFDAPAVIMDSGTWTLADSITPSTVATFNNYITVDPTRTMNDITINLQNKALTPTDGNYVVRFVGLGSNYEIDNVNSVNAGMTNELVYVNPSGSNYYANVTLKNWFVSNWCGQYAYDAVAYFHSCRYSCVSNVTIINEVSGFGLEIYNSPTFTVTNSVFYADPESSDTASGIYVSYTNGITITNSEVYGWTSSWNSAGIYFDEVQGTITKSIIQNCYNGIYLTSADYDYWTDTVTGNFIIDNTNLGLLIDYDNAGAYIYNNFFNNTENAQSMSAAQFNLAMPIDATRIVTSGKVGGNYWATPDGNGLSQIGPDTDKNGFVDVPLRIFDDGGVLVAFDNFPYSGAFVAPPIQGGVIGRNDQVPHPVSTPQPSPSSNLPKEALLPGANGSASMSRYVILLLFAVAGAIVVAILLANGRTKNIPVKRRKR